jgi:hypothetical protein
LENIVYEWHSWLGVCMEGKGILKSVWVGDSAGDT